MEKTRSRTLCEAGFVKHKMHFKRRSTNQCREWPARMNIRMIPFFMNGAPFLLHYRLNKNIIMDATAFCQPFQGAQNVNDWHEKSRRRYSLRSFGWKIYFSTEKA